MKTIKLTDKQSSKLFHHDVTLRVKRKGIIYYIDKYGVSDWTGKVYKDVRVLNSWEVTE